MHARYIKYKYPNHSNTAGHIYVFNADTVANIQSQCWHLLLVVSVYMTCAKNSFYLLSTVVIHATFGLLVVAAFLESSEMSTAD